VIRPGRPNLDYIKVRKINEEEEAIDALNEDNEEISDHQEEIDLLDRFNSKHY